MKLFIWQQVSSLTDNYHDGGGLMVAAESLEEARKLWKDEIPKMMEYPSDSEEDAFHVEPDCVLDLADGSVPRVWVFPDAGCC